MHTVTISVRPSEWIERQSAYILNMSCCRHVSNRVSQRTSTNAEILLQVIVTFVAFFSSQVFFKKIYFNVVKA